MNLALSKMVQYLGSTNVFLSALAYDEVSGWTFLAELMFSSRVMPIILRSRP